MKVKNKKLKGFTLIEMIISTAILSVLILVLSNAFGSLVDVQLESSAKSSVDQDGRYILSKLSRNVQDASAIVSPSAPGTSSSFTIKSSIDSLNYTYSVNNGNLQVVSSGAPINLNSYDTSISNMSFTRVGVGDNTDTLQVKFTIISKTLSNGAPKTKDYQTTLSLQ
jgi:prepilin-type N-terminal cleavage/methylation domain-containing protein